VCCRKTEETEGEQTKQKYCASEKSPPPFSPFPFLFIKPKEEEEDLWHDSY